MMKASLLVGFASLAYGFQMPSLPVQRRSSSIRMAGEQPDVRFGANSDWKPTPEKGSKHTMSGGFESTDTPDFFDDSEYSQQAANLDIMDGVMGSTGLGELKKRQQQGRSTDPGVAGALDVNPDIYMPDAENLSAASRGITFELPKSGMTDLDFDISCDSQTGTTLQVDVRPVAMTFEEFYCGFTSDSHPAFRCTPTEGKMERRNGPPTTVTVECDPNGKTGELVGYLCFILPEEKAFSTYYKITCVSR